MFKGFNLDKLVMFTLGAAIVLSVTLAVMHNIQWLWLTLFIGFHQMQVPFTNYCLVARTMKNCGVKPGKIFE